MKKIVYFLLIFHFTINSQQLDYEVFNTSINSKYAEFGVTYLNNNTIIFASSKKDEIRKRRTNRQLYLELYIGEITDNGDIIETDRFSNEINNKFFESDVTFTKDLKTVYFTWNNYYNSLKYSDLKNSKALYLFKATVDKNFGLSNIEPLPFNSKRYSVRNPKLSKDEKQLFFISDMDGGYGGMDIYVVNITKNGSFSAPKNLGPNVNTSNDEFFPYIDENNTLYFSSYGHLGLGNLDIFKSEFKNGTYQKAENLPEPINSKFDDFAFVINHSKNTGYFTSNRNGGIGGVDIYAFKPKLPDCNQIVTGLVYNKNTGKEIDDVEISLLKNGELIETHINQFEKKYNFKLDCNSTYSIIAQKEHFETLEIEIDIDTIFNKKLKQNLELTPILCSQLLMLQVVDEETGNTLENANILISENNQFTTTNHLQKELVNFPLACNKAYKINISNEHYEDLEFVLKTDNDYDRKISKTIKLTPKKCTQLITGNILNKETNKSLIGVTLNLYHNNTLIASKNVKDNSNYTFEVECDKLYKVVAKKENFETLTSEVTTNKAYNSTIQQNFELAPISCNQLLTLNIIDSKTKKIIANSKITVFENNESLGNFSNEINLDCHKTYQISITNDAYEDAAVQLITANKNTQTIKKTIELTRKVCTQLISGKILNKNSNQIAIGTKVLLYQNNKLVNSQIVKSDGTYNFELNCNEAYKVVTENKHYQPIELEILNPSSTTQYKNIELTPLKCEQFITGKVIDFNTQKELPNAIVTLYENNSKIDTLKLDKSANFKYKINCNKTYKLVSVLKNYNTYSTLINTSNELNKTIQKNIVLDYSKEFITVRDQKMIKTNPIYFDLDKSEIRTDAAIELNKVVEILQKYPKIKIEIKSHTDSRAPDNYNMKLSNSRAKSTISYIIAQGIDSSRVTGRGYGETQLVNKCANGVKCSDAEHQLNRRTEFIVIDE